MKVCNVTTMVNMDKTAIKKYSIPAPILMENAAISVCNAIERETGIKGLSFTIFCGTGNNGGDGLGVGRKLLSYGANVKIVLLGGEDKFKGAALDNLNRIKKIGIDIHILSDKSNLNTIAGQSDVIVDAIFGTGLKRDVQGLYRDTIEWINRSGLPVVSVDIPSGINGDTGQIMGSAVLSDFTVTFGLPKYGTMLYPGFDFSGRLYVSHISFPPELYNDDSIETEVNIPGLLPERNPMGHKGSFGNILVVSGAKTYYGAPLFSSLSAYKAGAGYVRLAAPDFMIPHIAQQAPEVVFVPMTANAEGSMCESNRLKIEETAGISDCVVLGPGLSLNDETQILIRELAARINKFMIIDGDGLTALKNDLSILKKRSGPTLLTPHAGELSRLTGLSVKTIQNDPVSAVKNLAEKTNSYVVLKGAHSLICSPDNKIWINITGNNGMATAGSGDVLTGTIAALFGQGMEIPESIKAGVFIHGMAGDIAAEKIGQRGMTAADILDSIPEAVLNFIENYNTIKGTLNGKITVI
ncbi:NAD(P)H-hydrate dehydratase [bacterium]|nr:NAD(P)H-hydrate dehydratase [bacterium]